MAIKRKPKKPKKEHIIGFTSDNFFVKNKDLLKRIIFTLCILIIIRIGSYLTVPGVQVSGDLQNQTSSQQFFNLISLLGGGTLGKFSILALGVSPYITASIIVQLLSTDVVPVMTRWSKSGEKGRKKLDRVTKILTVPFALMQGIATIFTMSANKLISPKWGDTAVGSGPPTFYYILVPLCLLAGTLLMIWMADQITIKGIGNGVSIVIFAGIVSRLPFSMQTTFKHYIQTNETSNVLLTGILEFTLYMAAFLLVILFVVILNESERRVPIQQTGSGLATGRETHKPYLPLKVNCAGVIPVIFSSAIISAPVTVAQIIKHSSPDNGFVLFTQHYLSFQTWPGIIIYGTLTIMFTFLYALVQVNPDKISENFQKSGTFIPGVKPGEETRMYLTGTISRISFLGSFGLASIAVCPYIISKLTSLPSKLAIGGTGLIIMVSVSMQTIRQVKGRIIQQNFISKKSKSIEQESDYDSHIW